MSIGPVLRRLARARGFSLAVTGTLAAGVAALTLAFGAVDAALWRLPPFSEAENIAIITSTRLAAGGAAERERWSYPRVSLLRSEAKTFERIANFTTTTLNLSGGGDPEPVSGEIVSPEYFPLLRVGPLRGRAIAAADDQPGTAHAVAVIGYDLWVRRFAAAPAILGSTMTINGAPVTVVGVMPRGFRGVTDRAEVWIPTSLAPSLTYPGYLTTNQDFISAVGRLGSGVSLANANAELATVGARVDALIPPNDVQPGTRFSAAAVPLNAARADAATRRSLIVLLCAVGLLHLLACANVVNLLLGRAAARRHEAALRAALGATSGRLAALYGGEAFALAGAGGAIGVAVAAYVSPLVMLPANVWFARNFFGTIGTFDAPDGPGRLIAFGAAAAAVTALFAACAPVAGLLRLDPCAGMQAGARAATGASGSLRRPGLRGMVVAIEVALAVVLVVCAGLMVRSFAAMRATNIGIQADHLLTFWIRPSEARVPPRDAPQFISRILAALDGMPGVVATSVDGGTPLSGSASSTLFIVGRPVPANLDDAPDVDRHYVAPGHFRTLGIPLLRGRVFTDADDAGHAHVATISETAARRFWPGQDPIGQRVWFGSGTGFNRPDSSATIVGIVGDVADERLDGHANRASFYTPYQQFTYAARAVFVRTAGDPLALVPAARKAVASVAPDLPLYDVQTMEQRIGGSWARHRFDAELFTVFGVVALLLAAIGTYAVVAYAVARRTREMGIRLALGARPAAVVRLVVREGLAFPSAGLAIGIVGALAVTRLLRSELYGVGTTDLRVFAVTAALLLCVSVLACIVPALRATRADPLEALRAE
ncbi:MAG: ADOP family duplicated permease [Gemmatimonadales bacterium]